MAQEQLQVLLMYCQFFEFPSLFMLRTMLSNHTLPSLLTVSDHVGGKPAPEVKRRRKN
jgi:hypothetical protein